MGWGEELDKMDDYRTEEMKKRPEFVTACETELTEESEELRRLFGIEGYRLTSFIKRGSEGNSPCVSQNEFPRFADLFCHPEVLYLVDNAIVTPDDDPTMARLQSVRDNLPRIVSEVKSTIRNKMVALVAKGYAQAGINHFDPERTLDLATTIFSCEECREGKSGHVFGSETIRPSDVMFHYCTRRPASQICGVKLDVDVYFERLDKDFNQCNWNRHSQASFKPENQRILSEVVTLVGLDPKTTISAQMDALDPIYECLSCNSPSRGRPTMRWSAVHSHHILNHMPRYNDPTLKDMKLEVMCKEMTCAHCLDDWLRGDPLKIKEHVRTKHGILHPTNHDVARRRDEQFAQPVFWMWPPRD